jgi:hypothetical protein
VKKYEEEIGDENIFYASLYCRRRFVEENKKGKKNKFVLRIAFSYTNTHPIISHFHSATPACACVRLFFLFSFHMFHFFEFGKMQLFTIGARKSFSR